MSLRQAWCFFSRGVVHRRLKQKDPTKNQGARTEEPENVPIWFLDPWFLTISLEHLSSLLYWNSSKEFRFGRAQVSIF